MTMEKILKEILSLEKLWISSAILWFYRIGIVAIAIIGILYGLSTMSQNFLEGLFQIVIVTPLAILVFRLYVELMFLLVGIYNRLTSINEKLEYLPQRYKKASTSCGEDGPQN